MSVHIKNVHIKNGRIFILVKDVFTKYKKESSCCKNCCFFGNGTECIGNRSKLFKHSEFPMCYLGHYFIEVSENGI